MFKKKNCIKCANSGCKRRGFSTIESLILIIVIGLTIGAILQTSAATISMQMNGRQRIDSFAVASSWFAALESLSIKNDGSNFDDAVEEAKKIVGPKSAYISDPKLLTSVYTGALEVQIKVWDGDNLSRTLTKCINKYTPETVSDDREVA